MTVVMAVGRHFFYELRIILLLNIGPFRYPWFRFASIHRFLYLAYSSTACCLRTAKEPL